MKRLGSLVLIILLAITVFASHYNRTISVTGGSPQRLSSVLSGDGYGGSFLLDELTICVPSTNTNTLYLGQSNVSSSNGFPLEPGSCYTQRSATTPIDAGAIYLRVSSTESEQFSLRSR